MLTMKGSSIKRSAIYVTALALLLTGCSNGNNSTGGTPSPTPKAVENTTDKPAEDVKQEPLELSLMYNFDGVEFPEPDNEIEKYIEEITNTKLAVTGMPGSAWEEKLPVMIASGDMPDAFPIPRRHQKLPYVINAVQADMFWEIGPYLDQFPNLSKINPVIYDNIKYDGKTYGLPRERALARRAFQYRSDWLANLGMEEPKTIDEFYEMLRAFTYDDPDGNGKDDTYGLSAKEVGMWFAPYFGAPNQWKVEDGKFIRDVQTEEFLNSLKFEKKLYDEGLMNKDFTVVDRAQWSGAVETGKAGVRIDVTGSTGGLEVAAQENLGETATFSMFSILEGEHGKRINMEGGHNGFFLFPKSSIKDEAELLRVLKFFDDLAGEELSNLFHWGIEGENYEIVDGKAKRIDLPEGVKQIEFGAAYGAPLSTLAAATNAMPGELDEHGQLEAKLNTENVQYGIADPTMPLISETFLEQGAQLETILTDAHVKFVMGQIDEDQWKAEVNNWYERGGKKIIAEYEEAYAKSIQ